jgi:hypothetical protein
MRSLAVVVLTSIALFTPARVDAQSVRTEPAARVPDMRPASPGPGEDDASAQVTPPALPTRVRTAITVLGLNRVSAPNEAFPTFDATVMLTVRWNDPRLAFDAAEEGDDRRVYLGDEALERMNDIWTPDLTIENEEGERALDARTLVVRNDGTVTQEEIFDARFRVQFDLRAFPFDTQSLRFVVVPMAWNTRQVVLEAIEDRMTVDDEVQVRDWTLGAMRARVAEVQEARSGRPFSQMTIDLPARRHPGFYLSKVMLPLLLIVACTWTTFWMTGEPAGTRLQRGFIALLSIVAFTQVIAQHLPRISYVTFLDAVMYFAFASTGATLIQVVATHRAEMRGAKDVAAKLDRIARVAFPVAFALALATLFVVYGAL